MIMEDVVARGADPRDSTRPMTVDQVAAGVRGLARLHSAYWGDRLTGNPALGWVEPFVAFEGMQYAPLHIARERLGDTVRSRDPGADGEQLFIDIWARYIGNADDVAADAAARRSAHRQHLRAARRRRRLPGLADGAPGQLVARPRVLPAGRADDRGPAPQRARTARGVPRRADLPADEMPSADEVLLRYRASVAHGLAIWMATLSGGDAWQRPEICLALAQRYAAAFIDLDTRAAIDAIA